jgi:CheY-like chemotaxis protein
VNDFRSSAAPGAGRGLDTIAVLLVDDQRFVGMAVERLLAGEPDIKLHFCPAASEALARAREVSPSVIFQDLEMPEIDGLTLVGSYRRDRHISATPIVVLSGNDDGESRTRALAAGANDYMVKLPDKQTLVACIRKYARLDEGAGAASTTADADQPLDRAALSAVRDAVADGTNAPMMALIDQFIREATELMAQLADGVARRDGSALKAAGHTLKGTALVMGATRLGAMAGDVERNAIDGTLDGVADLVRAMGNEWELVRTACLRELHELRS